MKAAVFVEPGRIVLDEKPIPEVGPLDALMRITTTTIFHSKISVFCRRINWSSQHFSTASTDKYIFLKNHIICCTT
jgi:hypothetical protein